MKATKQKIPKKRKLHNSLLLGKPDDQEKKRKQNC